MEKFTFLSLRTKKDLVKNLSNVGIGKAIKMKGERRIFIVKVFFLLYFVLCDCESLPKNVSEENKHTNVNVN
jgi:hypothetical protein